jgi:hypothetical protein
MKAFFLVAIIVSTLASGINVALGQGLAFAGTTLPVGNYPTSVTTADVNNDGKVDLICANMNDSTLSVFTNDGSGGFVSNMTINVSVIVTNAVGRPGYVYFSRPTCVIAADLYGNGKLDLISAMYGGRGCVVCSNDGSGGFVTYGVVSVLTSGFSSCVAAADITGDGNLDLIVESDYRPPALEVFTNNGIGGFSHNTILNVSGFPTHWVAAADLNGDGAVDLISANHFDNTLTVLTNNGSGVFGSGATYNVGASPECVAAADLIGNGKMDLVSANSYDNTVTVLTNNGSGGFVSNATYTVGAEPFFVTTADLNGDGKLDLISANAGTNTLTVLTNDGSGGFAVCTTLTVGNGPVSIAVADVNGDGRLDLITANSRDNTVTVLTQVMQLTITPAGLDEVAISWPSTATNFVLQTNADLTTTNWGLADYLIATNGPTESVTVNPSPSGNLFFRLMSQ